MHSHAKRYPCTQRGILWANFNFDKYNLEIHSLCTLWCNPTPFTIQEADQELYFVRTYLRIWSRPSLLDLVRTDHYNRCSWIWTQRVENGKLFMNGEFLAKIWVRIEISMLIWINISQSYGNLIQYQMVNHLFCSLYSFDGMRFDLKIIGTLPYILKIEIGVSQF